jgi:SPP1 gp7 family putative phage head morphogenesis protein
MLELDYNKFMDIVDKNPRQQDRRILHYLEEDDKITLYIKSVDYWEYFTVIKKEQLYAFGDQYSVSEEQAVRDFKRSVLFEAVPLKEKEVFVDNLPEELRKEVEAGEDIIDESKDYEEFLVKQFTKWETSIFSFLERTLKDELLKDVNYMEKSFGEFIRQLFNNVNTVGFKRGLIATIKATMKEGVDTAEKELNVDIGFGPEMMTETKVLADRQLEGFYIEGKRWKGLKGVAEDVQLEVSQIVRDGIVDKKGIGDIKTQIQERLNVTKTRATAIARTETNRFMNHSKILSYQKSGIVKELEWDAFHDNRTSKQCIELDKKRVPLGKFFELENGQQFAQPPAHVNCRSIVNPIFIDED